MIKQKMQQWIMADFYQKNAIRVKILCTPYVNDYRPLLNANLKNHKRLQIYLKRSFTCHQAEIFSLSRLEMASMLS